MAGYGDEYGGLPWGGATLEEAGNEVTLLETLSQGRGASVAVLTGAHQAVADTLTRTEAADTVGAFAVLGAFALGDTQVRVFFELALDPAYGPNLDPSSYTVTGTTVLGVTLNSGGLSVTLTTDPQGSGVLTATVLDAQSLGGDPINLTRNTADFWGYGAAPYFWAAFQSPVKIILKFSQVPASTAALLDPSSYTVTSLSGVVAPVSSVALEGPAPASRVALTLAAPLTAQAYYQIRVSPLVTTQDGYSYFPDTYVAQLETTLASVQVAFGAFSGEVQGGLFGQPAGQVFFSPALQQAASGSEIEVAEVRCCTRAGDQYVIPPSGDFVGGLPLMTWPTTTLVSGGGFLGNRLWATGASFGDASLDVTDRRLDAVGSPVDSRAIATLTEVLDPSRGSRTNSIWITGPTTGPNPFMVADNLTPIGPGTTQTFTLQP